MAHNDPKFDQTCCGVVEEAKYRSREKRANQRQPWIARKFAVGMTAGLLVYTTYVYIGRFCVPMIKRDGGALGGRAMGIGFLVVFCILALMTYWSYLKVVLTPPGQAKDYVSKSDPPPASTTARFNDSWESGMGWQYEGMSTAPADPSPDDESEPQDTLHPSEKPQNGHPEPVSNHERRKGTDATDADVGDLDAVPPVAAARAARDPAVDAAALTQPRPRHRHRRESSSPPQRTPSTTPVLLPEYRYCYKEGFVKPLRTHHCRACGVCILRFDHHCPWIGQCVGALNVKFFYNFLQWSALFCIWVFSTLLAQNVKAGSSLDGAVSPDGQQIAIIAVSGVFMLFTCTMAASQTRLILSNQTTVEHLDVQRMKEKEKAVLARSFAWYQIRAKRRTRKQWEEEWGSLGREGNLWWLGSERANWEGVMGSSPWGWFLPVGRSEGNGLEYATNPRFDEQGRWRRRREWPGGLR